jgi:hypothetical protein
MTMEEAVLQMRREPRFSELVHNSCLDADNRAAAERKLKVLQDSNTRIVLMNLMCNSF